MCWNSLTFTLEFFCLDSEYLCKLLLNFRFEEDVLFADFFNFDKMNMLSKGKYLMASR
jgi:hypothetical protein